MPAVDPDRLTREVEALCAQLPDLERFQKQAVDLVSRYEDTTRRPSRSARSGRRPVVPRPLIRTFVRAFLVETSQDPVLQREAADSLWDSKHPALRRIAIHVASRRDDDDLPVWMERWIRDCERPVLLDELAQHSLQRWEETHPGELLEQVERWLGKPWIHLHAFALLVLKHATGQPFFENLPAVFRLLHPVDQFSHREERQALVQLVEGLARRSPQEAAYFLLGEVKQGGKEARRLAERTARAFPAAQRGAIQRTLSAS